MHREGVYHIGLPLVLVKEGCLHVRKAKSCFGCKCRWITLALHGWNLLLRLEKRGKLRVPTKLSDKGVSKRFQGRAIVNQ